MEPKFALLLILLVFHPHPYQSSQLTSRESALKLRNGVSRAQFDPSRIARISWSPRAFLYKGFLSDEECDYLIHLGIDKLERSTVIDDGTNNNVMSEYRTSYGVFLTGMRDKTVASIEARIAAWTMLPKEHGEALQILRYQKDQKYDVHADYTQDDKADEEQGGNRMATVLMYLSNVAKGGETVFPSSQEKHKQPKGSDWSVCAEQGYAVKPRKGDALLFFCLYLNTSTDPSSMHGACPVIEGEKWSATKWIHVRPYDLERPSGCVDESPNCSHWALAGECEKNRGYMVGSDSQGQLGYCRKSCKICSV